MSSVVGHNKKRIMSCSTLSGDSVFNSKGEKLGSVEDIMIHIDLGRIAYVVLSFGGILGIGDKLFAIPWEALTLDEDQHAFILNVDKEQLERAPGFDKDSWPDMADPSFGSSIYGFYGYEEPTWLSSGGRFASGIGRQQQSGEDCRELGTC